MYWYHNDVSGMPRRLTGASGINRLRAEYRAWGNTLRVENIATRTGEPVYQPLRYQGKYFDAGTGLHYNRFRYYDPDARQFISQHPIGLAGGINLYQYAPNPLVWVEPLGLKTVTVYHYTDKGGYKGISSQKPYKFKASSPIKGHPKGIYVTTKSPEELAKTPNGFKKLGLTSAKSTHFYEFQIDDSQLKPIRGDRGEFIRYIEGDMDLDREHVSRHGTTPKCGGE
ncbi:RHS repeat-associated core domain-containing protein [Cronobacter dublinensis]